MITEVNNAEQLRSQVDKTITDAKIIAEELRGKLQNIKVKVYSKDSPEVIKALKHLFKDSTYMSDNGEYAYITYDMYCSIINMLRTLGNYKAIEVI